MSELVAHHSHLLLNNVWVVKGMSNQATVENILIDSFHLMKAMESLG